ncbi:MAG TPA: hypothetical protein VG245_06605, partial [Candidatus Dormibacteraeota bacterium]|nr:hypothetical protein [Candidatus Dormibacteraeota bacterium]
MNKRQTVLRLLTPVPATLVALATLAQAPPALAQSGIQFEVPSVVDPIHTYGEPDVGINPVNNKVFVSGPGGTGQQRSLW